VSDGGIMDLLNELEYKRKQLEYSVVELKNTGKKYASAYTEYRKELAKELLRLKSDGMPVTIAYDIARGNELVAKLKFDEISSEALYKANLESINVLKLEIKIIQEQINKEFSNE
jgi:hypothetical protein